MRRKFILLGLIACLFAACPVAFAETIIDFDFTAAEGFDDAYQLVPDSSPGAGDGTTPGALVEQNGFIGHDGADGEVVSPNKQSVWQVDTTAPGFGTNVGTASVYNNWIGMAHTNPISNLQVGETVRTTLVYKENLGAANAGVNQLSRLYIGYRTRAFDDATNGDPAPFLNAGTSDGFGDKVDMWMKTAHNIYPNPDLNDGQEVLEGTAQFVFNNNNDAFDETTTLFVEAPDVGWSPFGTTGPADPESDWLEVIYEVTKLATSTIDDFQWEVNLSVDNLEDEEPAFTETAFMYGSNGYDSTEWYPSLRSGDVKANFDEPRTDSVVTVDRYTVEVDRLAAPVTTDWVGATTNDPPNGFVDGVDLQWWEQNYGLGDNADGDGDFDSDGHDYLKWQLDYTGPPPALTSVPEPTGLALLALGLLSAGFAGRRAR